MDFAEKAGIRIRHWISHNATHIREYETFPDALETAGKNESARHIREMAALTTQSNGCLHLALNALG
jgi:hypothetical protein